MLGFETFTHVTVIMGTIVTIGRSMCVSEKAQFRCSKVMNQRPNHVCNLASKQKKNQLGDLKHPYINNKVMNQRPNHVCNLASKQKKNQLGDLKHPYINNKVLNDWKFLQINNKRNNIFLLVIKT